MKFLITYSFRRYGETHNQFAYSIADSPEKWVDSVQEYTDGEYILINALEVSDTQAKKWDRSLTGM